MKLPRRSLVAGVVVLLIGATGASVSSDSPVRTFVTTLVEGALVALAILGIFVLVRLAASQPAESGPEHR